MRKGIIVAVATLAMGLTGLFATPAKALQFGFNAGYTSVGFQLHGMGGEFLFGFQGAQGEDDRRPKGSVLRIGLAGAAGMGSTDLNNATWNGGSYNNFLSTTQDGAVAGARAAARPLVRANFPAAFGGAAGFDLLPAEMQQGAIDQGIAASQFPADQGGAAGFATLTDAQKQGAAVHAIEGIKAQVLAGLATVLATGYNITDLSDAKGDATAFFVSAAYEYVLPQGAPGLGFIVGGELYVSQGGYAGNPGFPSVSTEGGLGGGGVVGISYYLKNGFNMTVKTGLGIVDPGEIVYSFSGNDVTVELEAVFYASPTFALGFIY